MVQPKYQFSHLKQWCLKRQCVTFAKDFTFFDGMHLALLSQVIDPFIIRTDAVHR